MCEFKRINELITRYQCAFNINEKTVGKVSKLIQTMRATPELKMDQLQRQE